MSHSTQVLLPVSSLCTDKCRVYSVFDVKIFKTPCASVRRNAGQLMTVEVVFRVENFVACLASVVEDVFIPVCFQVYY